MPFCVYESEKAWRGPCPSCGRFYNADKYGADREKVTATLATLGNAPKARRISTGISEFDRVIGGGLVPGSTVVISGDPGTGKSTLMLQLIDKIATDEHPVIYASGEQNAEGVGLIAERVGVFNKNVIVMGLEGDVEKIVEQVDLKKAKLVIIDSLQKAFIEDVEASVGSVQQGKAVIEHLVYNAKKLKFCVIVISQVNKFGEMAGGKAVAHDVDTVLEFDYFYPIDKNGDPEHDMGESPYRTLRVGKNRNGPSGLQTLFEADENGVLKVSRRRSTILEVVR